MSNYKEFFQLNGKVALVTGSAQGIGLECAVALGDLGARVVLSDRDESRLQSQVEEFRARGFDAMAVSLDVTQEDQWQAAIAAIDAKYGRLDVLVNNAGIMFYESVEEQSLARFHQMMSVNVDGVYLGCKHAVKLMQKHASADDRASIVNLSSMAGLFGSSLMSAYNTSKGAVRLMSKSMAVEFGPTHVRVNSIHPGLIDTAMGDDVQKMLMQKMGTTDPAQALGFSLMITPLQALGTTSDIARAVAFMATPASNFMTATEVIVDGGISGSK